VPAEFVKGAEVHLVPLSRAALVLLGRLPRTESTWVFPAATSGCEVCTLPGHAGKLSTRVTRAVKRATGIEGRGLVHRLRDTLKTWASERGIDPRASEMLLGHVVPGIAGTYDHAELLAPRRTALAAWGRELRVLPVLRALKAGTAPSS